MTAVLAQNATVLYAGFCTKKLKARSNWEERRRWDDIKMDVKK
jgi:hypothetical protein